MIEPLDLNGPLTGGTVVLEASAGTGKTYALSHRVLREVGENGRAIDQILVVTFTRAATAETLAARSAQDTNDTIRPSLNPQIESILRRKSAAASPRAEM